MKVIRNIANKKGGIMRKIRTVAIIVIVGFFIGACTKGEEHSSLTPDFARNATFTIDGKGVSLINGKSEVVIPDSSAKEITELTNKVSLGNFADGKGQGLAVVLRQQTGGTGTFYYVAAVVPKGNKTAGTNGVFLGDRILIEKITLNDGIVTVNYLDRPEGAPMANKPTEQKTKKLKLNGETLADLK